MNDKKTLIVSGAAAVAAISALRGIEGASIIILDEVHEGPGRSYADVLGETIGNYRLAGPPVIPHDLLKLKKYDGLPEKSGKPRRFLAESHCIRKVRK